MALDITGIAPLLQVFDMPTSIRFYRDVLGFELISNSPVVKSPEGEYFHWGMLRRNGVTLMLNTAYDEGQRPAAPDPVRVAAHADAILFFGCPDVDATYQHLRSLGANVQEEPFITGYGMKRFTVADPDGYHLCFQWPVAKE